MRPPRHSMQLTHEKAYYWGQRAPVELNVPPVNIYIYIRTHIIAERLSVRQLIPRRISEIVCCRTPEATNPASHLGDSLYVCMYVCMYVSVTLKNARMSHLGMQFYTTLPKD